MCSIRPGVAPLLQGDEHTDAGKVLCIFPMGYQWEEGNQKPCLSLGVLRAWKRSHAGQRRGPCSSLVKLVWLAADTLPEGAGALRRTVVCNLV